jgi:DNA-binding transcriptional ArsR family regulator
MPFAERSQFEARARVLKALANPSRLILIDALAQGEKCVADLTALVGSDMSTVSRHLSVLKSAGIVGDRRQGLQIYYNLKMPCVLRFFDCICEVLTIQGIK